MATATAKPVVVAMPAVPAVIVTPISHASDLWEASVRISGEDLW